jgi:hypothetical protein
MNTTNNADAGKNVLWPGATPSCPRFSGPKRPAGFRVAPGHSVPPPRLQFGWQVCHPQSGGNLLPELALMISVTFEDFQHSCAMPS